MSSVPRRFFGKGLIAALSIPSFASSGHYAKASDAKRTSHSDSLDELSLHRRLVYAEGGQPSFWWLRGKKFGVLDGEVTHLWDISTGIISSGRTNDHGAYEVTVFEAFFQFHPGTTKRLQDWKNPYTGKQLQVPMMKAVPSKRQYADTNTTKTVDTPAGRMTSNTQISRPRLIGDTVWLDIMKRNTLMRMQADGTAQPFRIHETLSYSGARSAIAEGYEVPSARCDLDIWSDWLPWMEMGSRPGGLLTSAQGQKLTSYDDFPQSFRDQLTAFYPNVANDPVQFIRDARDAQSE